MTHSPGQDQPVSKPCLTADTRRAIPPQAVEQIWHTPDRAAIRRIDWPGHRAAGEPARGSILFLPGRADFYEKYLETLDHWHQQGWRVTALDWRWQAGSGRYYRDPRIGGVHSFATWVGDLARFWADWSAARQGPRVLIGHSMGGHLVLRALAEARLRPDAVVLSAPMLGFVTPIPRVLQPAFARAMCAIGDPARMAWRDGEAPGQSAATRGLALTHDTARYADELWWRERRPVLHLGPASWDWVKKAGESIRLIEQPGLLEAIETPVLAVAARHDALVSWPAIQAAMARIPHGELVDFGREAAHELLREADPVRDRVLAAIAEFLDRVAPGP